MIWVVLYLVAAAAMMIAAGFEIYLIGETVLRPRDLFGAFVVGISWPFILILALFFIILRAAEG